jgi:hypothetical protein
VDTLQFLPVRFSLRPTADDGHGNPGTPIAGCNRSNVCADVFAIDHQSGECGRHYPAEHRFAGARPPWPGCSGDFRRGQADDPTARRSLEPAVRRSLLSWCSRDLPQRREYRWNERSRRRHAGLGLLLRLSGKRLTRPSDAGTDGFRPCDFFKRDARAGDRVSADGN